MLLICLFSLNPLSILNVFAATVSDTESVDVTALVTTPGSGAGSSGSYASATVVISGFTFPDAKLTLLRDGQIATTLVANHDGTFNISVISLNLGNYQFSLYAEDRNGVVSSSYVVNVPVLTVQPYRFAGVVVPPTIQVSSTSVEVGKPLTISGYAPAGADINVQIPGQYNLGNTVANENGFYSLTLTQSYLVGVHQIRSQAAVGGITSLFSRPIAVQFYKPGQIPTEPSPYGVCVDYNKDLRINLVDFSILLFWFNKPNPPRTVDCNDDAKIDIKDFSILMYFWTG